MGLFDDLPDETPAPKSMGLFDDLPDETPVPDTPPIDTKPMGWLDYANGVAQRIARGVTFNNADEAAALMGSGFGLGDTVGLRNYRDILNETHEKDKAFAKQYPKTAVGSEIGGALLSGAGGTRFILNAPSWGLRALRSAMVAAPMGAANEVGKLESTPEKGLSFGDYASAAGEGGLTSALTGAGLSAAGSAVGATVGPWATAAAQRLSDQGIRLTPGELLGPYAKRLEDTLTSVPLVNRLLRNRQQEGVEDFNRVYHDRVLSHLNEGIGPQLRTIADQLPANVPVGREANQFVHQVISSEYNRIVPRLRGQVDTPFRLAVDGIESNLPRSVRDDFTDAVQRHLYDNLGTNGTMAGRDIQDAFQGLRDEGRRLITSGGAAYSHDLGAALMQVRDMLRTNVTQRSAPQVAQKFQNINRAYQSFVQTRKASGSVAAEFGVFTPAMAHSAVKATDQTAGKGAFSRGTAANQDLTDDAKHVMSRKISDSGTPERAAISGLIGGAGLVMPKSALATLAALGATYSPPGRAAFQAMATMSPRTRAALQRMINAGTSAGAPGTGALNSGE